MHADGLTNRKPHWVIRASDNPKSDLPAASTRTTRLGQVGSHVQLIVVKGGQRLTNYASHTRLDRTAEQMEVLTEAFLVTEQIDGKHQDRTLGWFIWIRIHALGERDGKKRSLQHDDQRVVFPPAVLQQDAIRGTHSTTEVPRQHEPRPHRDLALLRCVRHELRSDHRESAVRLAAAPVHRLHRASTDSVGILVQQRTQRRVDVVLDLDSTLAVMRTQRAVVAFHTLQRQWTTTTAPVLGGEHASSVSFPSGSLTWPFVVTSWGN